MELSLGCCMGYYWALTLPFRRVAFLLSQDDCLEMRRAKIEAHISIPSKLTCKYEVLRPDFRNSSCNAKTTQVVGIEVILHDGN